MDEERFRVRRPRGWRAISREINAAVVSVREQGYCWASWQPEVVALATPIVVNRHPVYVLNMSVIGDIAAAESVDRLHEPLLALAGASGIGLQAFEARRSPKALVHRGALSDPRSPDGAGTCRACRGVTRPAKYCVP